jgi:subtilisin-like proprotein convertase family protein
VTEKRSSESLSSKLALIYKERLSGRFFYAFYRPTPKILIYLAQIIIQQMRKTLLFSILAIVLMFSANAQNPQWREVPADRLASSPKVDRDSQPTAFKLFHVDFNQLKSRLAEAPSRDSGTPSTVVVEFPTPSGKVNRYRIYEASVMHPELAARYPEIQSYVGQDVDSPAESLRITTTVFGLHVMASTSEGTFYIDPYTKDLSNYIVYEKSKLTTTRTRQCLVEDTPESTEGLRMSAESMLASDGKFRTYRMAMACTVEYAAFHITAANLNNAAPLAMRKAAVLAAMNVTVARLNQVYERDLAVTLQLVPNNDVIIFVTSDTFNNDNAEVLIDQSQNVINANIGAANYDIGHTVSTGGGGLAQSPSVCLTGKARGITGSPSPVGDPFDIDFVAHEVGHQFGASHTFNGIGGNCTAGTRSPNYAVEPGSGSTIMAYAGICDVVNIQPNSDAHFHAVSIAQIMNHITGAGNCVAGVNNNNTPPVANAGANYTIPKGTAFILKGSATDANGDTLTYCWEQTDTQVSTQPPVNTSTGGPNFRSNPPSTSPNRYMPSFADVMDGNLTPTWEVVPNVARTLNFALTVRDNRIPNGGQTHRDDMTVTTANVGPFRVTYPDQTHVDLGAGSTQTITWDVAGTTANGINTSLVNILISTDNGQTFTTLKANTPNDGSEEVLLPSTPAPFCRIMVEAVGNIYYALSKSFAMNYTVEVNCQSYTSTPNSTISTNPQGQPALYLMGPGIFATSSAPISDMNVTINLTHPDINEIWVAIAPPGATDLNGLRFLYQNNCASGTAMNVKFDDQGANFNCNALTTTAAYKPVNSFSEFLGTAPNQGDGNWRIVAVDFNPSNNGVMNSFTFEFCSTSTTLATGDFGLTNFTLYPNPNNGSFNISFESSSTHDIQVGVHDLRGRRVYDKSYQNTGLFAQTVQLEGLQSGVYIVTVQDGDRKEVKRIVIE